MIQAIVLLTLILFGAAGAAAEAPPGATPPDESARVNELTVDAVSGAVSVPATATCTRCRYTGGCPAASACGSSRHRAGSAR